MADRKPGPFRRAAAERFDQWLHWPLPGDCADPRVDVRRACPDEFERIYDLVDDAFGVRRPRPLYDWLYRRNPHGTARCWVVVERSTGRFVGSLASVPWPFAHDRHPLSAALGGDCVVAAQWRGRGLNRVRTQVRDTHPMERETLRFGWPNAGSRAAAGRGEIDGHVAGPVPCCRLPLDVAAPLVRRGWPPAVAAAVQHAVRPAVSAWTTLLLRHPSGVVVEAVRRFDTAYDRVTERTMLWDGYWFPHDADFLNWRYLDHPTQQYLPFAVMADGEVTGYCVVRVDGQLAWLMELAAPPATAVARALLWHAVAAARDAGCGALTVCAAPHWPHWRLLRAAGFAPMPIEIFFFTSPRHALEVHPLTRWQFLPGDIDSL